MIQKPNLSLSDWNWAVLMLTQAMIGAVSPNFRLITLTFEDEKWVVRVTLHHESDVDREEINEICGAFMAYLMDLQDRISPRANAEIVPDVIVSQAPISLIIAEDIRYVFRMRESC